MWQFGVTSLKEFPCFIMEWPPQDSEWGWRENPCRPSCFCLVSSILVRVCLYIFLSFKVNSSKFKHAKRIKKEKGRWGGGRSTPRRSERKRKRVSFGEEFLEQWSPPRGSAATASGLSEDPLDPTENEPGTSEQTITWPSEPRYYSQELPPNHRKRLPFIHKRLDLNHKRSSSALYLMYFVYARNELVSFVSGNL